MELTGITVQNRDFFKHLAPIELLKRAGTFGYYGIGAAEGKRPELVGTGTILFCIRKDSLQESYATIEWIYVREDLRRQGIGLALLSKMESGIASKGPESICRYRTGKEGGKATQKSRIPLRIHGSSFL